MYAPTRWVGLLVTMIIAGLVASGCNDAGSSQAQANDPGSPRRGGTVTMGTAQEPPVINRWLAAGGMGITAIISDPLNSPWVRIDEHGQWQPVLATSVPTLANGGVRRSGDGMVIDLEIDPRAAWSDRVPITCTDLRFTWQTVLDDRWQIGTRVGWEQIDAIDCPSPRKAQVRLRTRYAPYLTDILATPPLPEHELRNRNFNDYWSQQVTVSSGPFVFDHWRRGVELVLRRNRNYWNTGEQRRPWLDKLTFRFVPDAGSMKLDLRMEEVDLIGLPPDTNLPQELAAIRTATSVVLPGAAWEQVAFNTTLAPVDDVLVRRAIAHAIDRDAIAEVVLRRQVDPLQSTLLPSQQPFYQPSFERYRAAPTKVEELMQQAGYARTSNGVWQRDGTEATLELKTTAGNPLRLKLVQLMQQQLQAAGFVANVSVGKPEIFFSQVISHGDFHLAIYSSGAGSDPSQVRLFSCNEIPRSPGWSGKNNYRYCNRRLTRQAQLADQQLDPDLRGVTMRQMQETLAADLPALPLFQPPDTIAFSKRLHGVRPNPMGRHTWNTEDWWVQQ